MPAKLAPKTPKRLWTLASPPAVEKQAWITRIEGKQADQAEDHHEEKKNADNFFFHICLPTTGKNGWPLKLHRMRPGSEPSVLKSPPEREESPAGGRL
jgi:hypothetical protein